MWFPNEFPSRAAARASAALVAAVLMVGSATGLADESQADTPEGVIANLHDGLVEASARTRDAGIAGRYQALQPLINASHDLEYIAQFTIRRQWSELSPAQQQAFVDAFERLSIMTYVSRFVDVDEGTFRLLGSSEAGAGRAEVAAAIVRRDADDIPLEYLLHDVGDGWRIINIVADGVSDLALKRAEYQRVLAGGSFEALVTHLEGQIERLEAEQ